MVFIRVVLVTFLCLSVTNLTAEGVSFFIKKETNEPIEGLQVFSERCSGSNYVEALIRNNVFFVNNQPYFYGWKHSVIWYNLPRSTFACPDHWYDLSGSEKHLIIVIFRNPYDWVRSFYKTPHHVNASVKSTFGTFITAEWSEDKNDGDIIQFFKHNPYLNKNPDTLNNFKNVFELRTYKIKNMLLIKEKAKNVVFVNYENILKNPQGFIDEITEIYNLQRKGPFVDVLHYKGNKKKQVYKKKQYVFLGYKTLSYINSQLDHDLEKSIGYEILTKVEN